MINGNGQTSRDFPCITSVVQANLRTSRVADTHTVGQVYNVAVGGRATLLKLHDLLGYRRATTCRPISTNPPSCSDFCHSAVRTSH